MEPIASARLYRIPEVVTQLALSRSMIYREIDAGNLHAVRIGAALRVTSDELNRYVASLSERTEQVA